jgi:hypothetical protein
MKEIQIANAQVPAHLAARIGKGSSLTASLSSGVGTSSDSMPRISIKGARFRLVEDGTETVLPDTTLEAVIVGANPRLSKVFYAQAYDKDNEPEGPDCFSFDGVRPDISVAAPENDICATCPNNVWGSKIGNNGQKLKSCADQKRLAIVAADDPEGTIYLLQVTPAALKGLNQYHKDLSLRGIPAEVVRTRISFDTDASFPKLQFSFGGFLDEDTQAVVDELFGTPEVQKITGELVEEAPQPKREPKPQLVHADPEPVEEEIEEAEPVEEATPVKGFGKATSAAAPKAKPQPKPRAAAKVDEDVDPVDDLAAEIQALIGAEDDD